jgi:hypothetical protein
MAYQTFNREQLVDAAIRVLGTTPIGQTPPDEERRLVDAHVIPLLARLNGEDITRHVDLEGNVTQLGDPDAIPASSFDYVAILLAEAARQDFSIPGLIGYRPIDAENGLQKVWAVGPTQENVEVMVTDLDTDTETWVTERRNQTLVGEFF